MGRCIIKLSDGQREWYLEWSTTVDAPVTFGMSLEELKEYYRSEYGEAGMAELPHDLARLEETGLSGHNGDLDGLLAGNAAGDNGEYLTNEELIKKYCLGPEA